MFHSPDVVEAVNFSGTQIKLLELKRAIVEKKKFSKGMNFDLNIQDAENPSRGRSPSHSPALWRLIFCHGMLFSYCCVTIYLLTRPNFTFNKYLIGISVHISRFFAVYSDDNCFVPKNTTVVVKRKPVPSGGIGLVARLQGGAAATPAAGSWRAP
jgi:hypothetical protein